MKEQRHYSFGQYHEGWLDRVLFLLRTRLVRKELAKIKLLDSLLDIGCGYHATLLRTCRRQFPSIQHSTGLDLQVNPALSEYGITGRECDINKPLPLNTGTCAAAVSTALFEHLEKPDLAAREVFRVLKVGGILITTTPSPSAKPVLEFMALKLGIIDPTEILDHKNYFTPEALKKLFIEAGFKDVRVRKFFFEFNTMTISRK